MTTHTQPIPKPIKIALTAKVTDRDRLKLLRTAKNWLDTSLPLRLEKHRGYLENILYKAWESYRLRQGYRYATDIAKRALKRGYTQRFDSRGSSRLDQARFYLQVTDGRQRRALAKLRRRVEWAKAHPDCPELTHLDHEIEVIKSQLPSRKQASDEVMTKLEERIDCAVTEAHNAVRYVASKLRAAYSYRWERGTIGRIPLMPQVQQLDRQVAKLANWRNTVSQEAKGKPKIHCTAMELIDHPA